MRLREEDRLDGGRCARRYRRLGARHPCHARAAGRRAQADGLDRGLGRHATVCRGLSDVTMMYSVVDIAGLNPVSARILANAAGAMAGMARGDVPPSARSARSSVASMFGVTTPCCDHCKRADGGSRLLVACFSCRPGAGGAHDGEAARGGLLVGVTRCHDHGSRRPVAGGVFVAVPEAVGVVVRSDAPQVYQLGALDMVNFGPLETRPRGVRGAQPPRPQPNGHADADDTGGVPARLPRSSRAS